MHRVTHAKLIVSTPDNVSTERFLPTGLVRATGRAIAILRDLPVGTEATLFLDGNDPEAEPDYYYDVVAERRVKERAAKP